MASGLVLKVTQTNAARHTSVPLASGDAVWVWWGGSDIVVFTR
jgi:putrescine transport system ATP-binding protein